MKRKEIQRLIFCAFRNIPQFVEINLSELLHLLSEEELLRLERRAQLENKNFLAAILSDEMASRALKD